MSEKKKTTKKQEESAPVLIVSKEKFEAAKADLAKTVEGVAGGERLLELVEAGYKKGKLSSSEMMEVLESMDLNSEQMDKIYDAFENLGVDTVGDDVLPDMGDDILPPVDELDEIPELCAFADKLEASTIRTIEEGIMTGDLAALSTLENKQTVDSETFLREIGRRLDAAMA